MSSVTELSQRILKMFREAAGRKEAGEIYTSEVYKSFLNEASHDMVQRAMRYLVDRDFIAPHSYSLTAKGRLQNVKPPREAAPSD
ncbi:MAG TPA: hypothetical protein VLV31_09060 [Candidatus Acidoferrales bacterium]|nr:hypothetical protein [Candidatus Acidoferrales bacterium]